MGKEQVVSRAVNTVTTFAVKRADAGMCVGLGIGWGAVVHGLIVEGLIAGGLIAGSGTVIVIREKRKGVRTEPEKKLEN